MSIFGVQNIDTILLQFLEVDDLRKLYQVNRYNRNLIKPKLESFFHFFQFFQSRDQSLIDPINRYHPNSLIALMMRIPIPQQLEKCIKISKEITISDLFGKSIVFGNLAICKYLFNKCKVQNKDITGWFQLCCYTPPMRFQSRIEITKWLHLIGADVHAENDVAFRICCGKNYLDIAKWLFEIGVNINASCENTDDDALIMSCKNGCLEVVKWLYSINVDKTNADIAFKFACQFYHVELAKWFCSIEPRYSIHVFEKKICFEIRK